MRGVQFIRQGSHELRSRQLPGERCALPGPLRAVSPLVRRLCSGIERFARIVGDRVRRYLTGRNAGLWTCGVTYGFAPHSLEEVPPDVLIEGPRELGELLR